MPKTDVLARVANDLARGHTQPAIQRLSSLVARHPTDLDLRRRLAGVHRLVGNRVEAGRWGYLDPSTDPEEAVAFERAYPSPSRRLAALRWPQRAGLAPTEHARRRLEELAAAASRETIRADGAVVRAPLRSWLFLAAVAAAAALAAIGAVTLAQWVL